VYCPEHGAPFEVKERVFGTPADFDRCRALDGFCLADGVLHARIDGRVVRLRVSDDNQSAGLTGEDLELQVAWPALTIRRETMIIPPPGIDTAVLWRIRTAWEGIFATNRPNSVNLAGER
jgi:hypothetical protein